MPPAGRKIIKRKPKGGATPQEFYFNAGTQDSIVEFNNEKDVKVKTKIFVEGILPAFNKLVENLINVYGFQIQYESRHDLQAETVQFLYGALAKFDPSKGTKAFSYFNVVAKNFLICRSKQSHRIVNTFTSLDDRETLSAHDLETIENHNICLSPEEALISEHNEKKLARLLQLIQEQTVTENEVEAFKGIRVLFDNLEDLDFLNKRAVMLYLREITTLKNPKQLSSVLTVLKKYYKTAKEQLEIQEGERLPPEPPSPVHVEEES